MVMKRIYWLLFIFYFAANLNVLAQDGGVSIGKGQNLAHTKAILELFSEDKGLLIPRMNTEQRNQMFPNNDVSAKGMLVFDTDKNNFFFWNGSTWSAVGNELQTLSGASNPINPLLGQIFYNTTTSLVSVYTGANWEQLNFEVINDLTTGGAGNVLSAEQGKILKALVDANTAKGGITAEQALIIAAISGVNTGDQDISGISTNASAISTNATAIATKVTSNSAITGGTNTKITYDAKGLVTGGSSATTADIAASTDKNYITDAQLAAITTNTAKVTNATHTGDVTGDVALTIGNDKILESHLKAVNSPTDEYVLTYEATTGDFEWVAPGTVSSTVTWNDLQVNINSVKKKSGVEEPSDVSHMGGYVLGFENNEVQGIYFDAQLPHSYLPGSDIIFHIHLIYDGSAGDVNWTFTYSWANVTESFPVETTVNATTSPGSSGVHVAQTIATIVGTGKRESSVLICSLTRNGNSDTHTGTVKMVALDFHYQNEKIGTDVQYPTGP